MTVAMSPSTVGQRTQIGAQTTDGTAVTATVRFPTLFITPAPETGADEYQAQGNKAPSDEVPNMEWSSFKYAGAGTFDELIYIFSSLLAGVTAPTPAAGVSTWVIGPTDGTPDVPQLYTFEHGDDNVASRTIDNAFTDWDLEWDRKTWKSSGTGIGKAFETGFTMTDPTTLTFVSGVPVQPGTVGVYLDTTFGGIGGTKLTDVRSGKLTIAGRWVPDWIVDPALPSYSRLAEMALKSTLSLKFTRDSGAMAHFAQYRAGTILYLRLKAIGPVFTGSTHRSLSLDIPVKFKKINQLEDDGGVYAIGMDLSPISDATAGFPMQATIVTDMATL